MEVTQISLKQHTSNVTIFKATSEEEIKALEVLADLIQNEGGVLSRKSFTFDEGVMTVEIDKYSEPQGRKVAKKPKSNNSAAK